MASLSAQQLVDMLESRKQRSGLSNRELQALKDARDSAWDENPNSIAGVMRRRQATMDAQHRLWEENERNSANMRAANAMQEQQLIGQNNMQGRSGVRQTGVIGSDPEKPEQYSYRDLKPGETYDPATDVSVDVGGGEPGYRRREVSPEYQAWTVAQAQKIKGEESGKSQRSTPAPASVITEYNKLLTARRDAQTPQQRAQIDEQLQAFASQYPSLGQGSPASATLSAEQAAQQAVGQGVPPEVAERLIGGAAMKQGGVIPREPIQMSVEDLQQTRQRLKEGRI